MHRKTGLAFPSFLNRYAKAYLYDEYPGPALCKPRRSTNLGLLVLILVYHLQ